MRALNSQRLRPGTRIFHSAATRSYSYLLFSLLTFHLLLLLHGVDSRSVLPQDDTQATEVPGASLLENKVRSKDSGSIDRIDEKLIEDEDVKTETNVDKDEGDVLPRENDETSVVKKRRRNDVTLPVKNAIRETMESSAGPKEDEVAKIEGIRRFDAEIESMVEIESVSDQSSKVNAEGSNSLVKGERSEKKAIKVDDVRSNESIAREVAEKVETSDGGAEQVAKVELDDTPVVKEDIRNDLRSLVSNEESVGEINGKKTEANESRREQRFLEETEGKFKHKSSTVYLSADDGSETPDGEERSIVDSQIKKLISIRDDVLGLASDNLDDKKKPDEAKDLTPVKLIGIDDTVIVSKKPDDDVRSQRSNLSDPPLESNNRVQKWKDQATSLQEQIKNRTFLQYLREHAVEVLPEIPKFTENQLLETLRNLVSSRKSENVSESYSSQFNATDLTENQLSIIKCAEQLVVVQQRQSFVNNMYECVRGLSVLNCMRIFVWPIIADNIPQPISQVFTDNIPIEINLVDLFQGNQDKISRSTSNVYQERLLTPESVVLAMLKQALESRVDIDKFPYFIDPKNETFQKLLTPGQLEILQMGEKLLPFDLRREYSDRMFSCVRRFEYLSCLRYFAWPMMRQYFPTLPGFPDYQTWYPSITVVPEYPIVPFPGFSDEVGELPEVVDSDATRMRKPTPETVIIHVLRNTLKEYPKVETLPPVFQEPTNFYTAVIPPDQLTTIQMAEQFLPVPYRPEFVQKTVRCIQEYNYLTCMKYSTWPTVKQFGPNLPDFSTFIPDFQFPNLSDIFSSLPNFPPTFSGLFGLIPSLPGNIPTQTIPVSTVPGISLPTQVPASGVLYRKSEDSKEPLDLESKIIETLEQVRNSLKTKVEYSSQAISGNVIILTTVTEKQFNILRLAESILPPSARATFLAQVLTCLQDKNDFVNCTRYVVWPSVTFYAPNLPDFSQIETQKPLTEPVANFSEHKQVLHASTERNEEVINPEKLERSTESIMSRTSAQNEPIVQTVPEKSTAPVISVTGTRFVPIYTEHPESVIINILQKIQLSSPNVINVSSSETLKTQLFFDLFNAQQQLIVRITEGLIPDSARPQFVNRMVECVRQNNFLVCSRDILWPTLMDFFPGVPNFPNFGTSTNPLNSGNSTSSLPPQNPTESGSSADAAHLSETNVKTGQHGDATVTITDTRFFPIFTETPEAIILNILEAVRISTPNLPHVDIATRNEDMLRYFTARQRQIIESAVSLLPEIERVTFIERMTTCIRRNTFLECTRDITWPTVHQYFPRLPSFPDFGILQNIARANIPESINPNAADPKTETDTPQIVIEPTPMEQLQKEIETILEEALVKESRPRLEHSYLDTNNPIIRTVLTKQQADIIRLTERGLPDPVRPTYVMRMLECMRTNNFMACSQHVSWPTLKNYLPSLPNFPQFSDVAPQLPGIGQVPGMLGVPNFPGISEIPNLPQFPPSIPSLPGGIQIPGQIPPFSDVIGQLPDLSQLGNIPIAVRTVEQPREQLVLEQEPSVITSDSKEPIQSKEQLSGSPLVPSSSTPSVDDQGIIPGYPGQPSGTLIDISTEKVNLPERKQEESDSKVRRRRNVVDLFNSYPESTETEKKSEPDFPNMDESEFLQLLIHVSKSNATDEKNLANEKKYFVDTLNSTIRNSLTAEQYEILKKVEDLSVATSDRSVLTRVVQCIRSLSFIRCMGIFVWPLISNNLPSLSSFGGFNPFGRSTEVEVEQFFGMSTLEFEKELLTRKEAIENFLVDSYRKLVEEKFETSWGFLKLKGYGHGEIGISFGGSREGRGTKIKDNKNLPSILTIISDIMEEVLDQRPDSDKNKNHKDRKEKSLGDFQDTDYQFLKYSDDDNDQDDERTKNRSINDEEIITMFLDKIKSNVSDNVDSSVKNYLNLEDAYGAFEVLFGTRLNRKFMNRLQSFNMDNLRSLKDNPNDEVDKPMDMVPLESQTNNNQNDLKVIPLDSRLNYDLEKESDDQIVRNRQDRTRNTLKSFVTKFSDSYLRETKIERSDGNRENEPDIETNSIKDDKVFEKDSRTKLTIQLPHLTEDIISRKITSSITELGRSMKLKMMQMLPGVGFVISFLVQMALSHARAAATMAGMLSNMALGSAMFGMIRQALFGPSTDPKIKYVYDNDKVGSGVVWPPKGYYAPYYG
ncbi:hypothetical protein KPH14_001847 [Odynerus spinipes]|uniref:Uncharacterized protein n=1 Tax=Odynerus spinipes TaxID=1348599 RepID=A0AAD9S0N3_9HYME|nr:hypothetical protein KPH14_001847 [Odynerus spinipes]